jgi:LuxR family maltose regulon positive regulatory protein
MEQFAVIISANFTLARLGLARGQFAEAVELTDHLNAQLVEENSPVLNSALDLNTGYIGAIMGKPRMIAGWLRTGDMEQSRILYQGMGFNYLVHAKALLQAGNNLKVEVLCEQMKKVYAKFNNIYGYLHTFIIEAAARYQLYGMEKAKAALKPALKIGKADGIMLSFAEYGPYILNILEELLEDLMMK